MESKAQRALSAVVSGAVAFQLRIQPLLPGPSAGAPTPS